VLKNPNARTIGHIIQGEIQGAIEAKGWPLIMAFDCDPDNPRKWDVEICSGIFNGLIGEACSDSVAKGILTAYLDAIRSQP
jgi:hypothetical protein